MADAFPTLGGRIERQSVREPQLVVQSNNRGVVFAIRAGDLIRAPRLGMLAEAAAHAEISNRIIRRVAGEHHFAVTRFERDAGQHAIRRAGANEIRLHRRAARREGVARVRVQIQ